jgi:hypothetical protein
MEHHINGKLVYIVEKHHQVLRPWAEYRRKKHSPIVISLDHHTDTRSAFSSHCQGKDSCKQENVSKIDYLSDQSINFAISNLQFDEHIDAALKADIILKAFIINFQQAYDSPSSYADAKQRREGNPHQQIFDKIQKISKEELALIEKGEGYYQSDNGLYVIGAKEDTHQLLTFTSMTHPRTCTYQIESTYLSSKLSIIDLMVPGLITNGRFNTNFILDIDLDYFHTAKSIHPDDCKLFHSIIKDSDIITIAKEPDCVDLCKCPGENINSDFLLGELLKHIEAATL